MANVVPFNVIMAPYTCYWAPVGTAFPSVDLAVPAGPWALLGASGTEDYSDGVTVTHGQTIAEVRTAGATGPRKASRTDESLMVAITLIDMTLETYRLALNSNALTATASGGGLPGRKEVNLYQGVDVVTLALLIRGASPYSGDVPSNMQYQLPNCYQDGSPAVKYSKGVAAALALQFKLLNDPNAASVAGRFGKLIAYTAVAS